MKKFDKFVSNIVDKIKPRKSAKKKFRWKYVLYYALYFAVGFLFITALLFAWFAKDLPTPSKIANRKAKESTKIYDRTGQILLYETGDEKRTIVKSDQLPQNLKDATIATEDGNFYKHHGFSTGAIIRAVFNKATGKTSKVEGTSTITQQYVKNALLTSDRSIVRKVKELILSIELEFMYSKDEILTMYLNEIPYGSSNAGAEAAAKMYYGRPAKDLTLAQAATLAAIPQAPTYYSPYGNHVDSLVGRKNYVLDRMVMTGKITLEEANAAKAEDTVTLGMALRPRKDAILAPHFSMYVLEQVVEQYGEEKIQKEGLKIITSLDYDKQKAAEEAIGLGVKKMDQYGASNAGLVAVDPKSGQILAMVGSKDYFNTSIDGNVNITDSLRQPGSSFKPFSYATAFKRPEFSPSRVLFDFQTDFGGGYVPRNYNGNFNGPVTMRTALSNSLNIPAIKTLSLAGIDNVIRTATEMGITTLNPKADYGLSLGVGTAEVKPVDMAEAFGVFANAGTKHDLKCVIKVSDSKGKVIYEYNQDRDKGRQVLDPQIAFEIASILSDNNARSMIFGAHSQLYFPNRSVAVKTGTTSDNKDAWSVGFTPSISVAVWVGNNNGKVMRAGADGSIVAAPIFHTFIDKALTGPNEPFVQPNGIQQHTVAKYSNKLPGEGTRETTTDIFASWQIPTEKDDTNVTVKVCRTNGKLAPEGLPENMAEQRSFGNIHSERPDNPNWENPVRAWAAANGYASSPPTEYCNVDEMTPTINILTPGEGQNLSGNSEISTSYVSAVPMKTAEFFIDDISIGNVAAPPFTMMYDFSKLSAGNHKISVIATDEYGTTARSQVFVIVAAASPTPATPTTPTTPATPTTPVTPKP